mmetsp:Transcript_36904/g.77078  ORF Transcript_36904/g.77078 Transcript_36904/m.77078 type:complete len:91 (-) Transcript_36904:35-307(-)
MGSRSRQPTTQDIRVFHQELLTNRAQESTHFKLKFKVSSANGAVPSNKPYFKKKWGHDTLRNNWPSLDPFMAHYRVFPIVESPPPLAFAV